MSIVQELRDVEGQLAARRTEWKTLFDQRPATMDGQAQAEELRRLNDVMTDLGSKRDSLAELVAQAEVVRKADADAARPVYRPGMFAADGARPEDAPAAPQSLGEQLTSSPGYKAWRPRNQGQVVSIEQPALGFKATFTEAGGTVTGYDRLPGLIVLGTQQPHVADLFARGQTTMPTVRYLREDTYTNAATSVAEGGTKPEASWDTSEVDATVRKIAVTTKVTDEIFEDFPAIRDYINQRLPFMVLQQEDAQLLTGDGVAPNLLGLLNTPGILTQAKGADPVPDAVYKGMIQVMSTGFFNPDGAVFHPLDWQDVKLLRTSTGEYIWGHPADMGPDRIWGLNVVITVSMTQNTAVVGAFKLGGQVFYRQGIMVEATNTNADDFVKNLITIRAEQRECLAIYRPSAFCTCTGV